MLLPKKTKFRKHHRGRRRGLTKGQASVQFGDFGIKALEEGWLTNRQIEAARIAMTRKIKRGGKVWINVFPDKPFTKKPAETRMGSGKGTPEGWVAGVNPGGVGFELSGVPEPLAREAMRLAGHKLPVKTKFVLREGAVSELEGGTGAGSPRRHTTWRTRSSSRLPATPVKRYSTCASSTPPGSWRTPRRSSGRSVTSRARSRSRASAASTWSAS